MTYIAKHAANRDEFNGSEVFDHEYHDPQVCTGDTDCPELAAPVAGVLDEV